MRLPVRFRAGSKSLLDKANKVKTADATASFDMAYETEPMFNGAGGLDQLLELGCYAGQRAASDGMRRN